MFGFLGSILGNPTGLIIAAVMAFAGLSWFAIDGHFKHIERVYADKDKVIVQLQEQVAGYIIDTDRLKLSNVSLEGEISTLYFSIDRVISETKIIIESDHDYNVKVSQLEKVIADQVRNDRILSVRDGRKAELLLRFINANVECWIENFENVNGACVSGVWRPNETSR